MPCMDDQHNEDIAALCRKLDQATRVACDLARQIRANHISEGYPGGTGVEGCSKETQLWVIRHDKADEARLRRERKHAKQKRLRAKALAKLTPKERKRLGL